MKSLNTLLVMTGLLVLQTRSPVVKLIKVIFFDKDTWSLIIEEIYLHYDNKLDKQILEGPTLPCLHSDGFFKATLKHPKTIVRFSEEICLTVLILDFIGRLSKVKNRYWLETNDFLNITG